jgi:signal transduction histidine kinase
MQRAARGEVVRDEEHEIVRPDGTSVFVYGHASPLFDAEGKVTGSVGAFMDVTERKAAEARQRLLADMTGLLTEALDVEKMLDSTARVAVTHLADWCVIDMVQSDGSLRREAAAHRDPAMQAIIDRVRTFQPERGRSASIFRALETGRPVLMRTVDEETREHINRDAVVRDAVDRLGITSYIAAPLVARGRSLGVLTLVRGGRRLYEEADAAVSADLASRAALALDNASLFHAADEANRAKDAFFAMVSHELRTPLTSIMGWATMLTKMDIDGETRTLGLNEIHRSARAQARIIDDLLDTARISAGKIRLEMTSVALDSVVNESISQVQQAMAEKDIGIECVLDPRAVVSGDRQRLVQIASNLLTNAVKFTQVNGTIHVTVAVDQDRREARFSVRDNGRGISAEFLPHVFDRFAQQEDSTGGMGLGLGLNIVKSFVDMHGGEVSVTSDGEGTGSEFTVTLPLAADVVASGT